MEKDIQSWQDQLTRAKNLYELMRELSIRQKELLEPEDELDWPMEVMLKLQNERQEIMQRIEDLDYLRVSNFSKSSPLTAFAAGDAKPLAEDEPLCQEMVEQIRKIILDIQAVDFSCKAKIEMAMPKIAGKISQTRENKKAELAYSQGNMNTSAWFFDKKQ